MAVLKGWIFDAYLVPQGISLWVIDESGRMHTFLDPWRPRLFVSPSPLLSRLLASCRVAVTTRLTSGKDFFTLAEFPVVEIRVHNPLLYDALVARLEAVPGLGLFNCDIHLVQAYHYERGHLPVKGCSKPMPPGS